MGACSSCLGRKSSSVHEDENSRLLVEDPNGSNYGAFGDQNVNPPQADPQDVQRETEALQKVVAQTSSHLVDVFAMIPQETQRIQTPMFSGQDARVVQYQDVLAKLSNATTSREGVFTHDKGLTSTDWMSDNEDEEETRNPVVKSSGKLVGGFADFEARTG